MFLPPPTPSLRAAAARVLVLSSATIDVRGSERAPLEKGPSDCDLHGWWQVAHAVYCQSSSSARHVSPFRCTRRCFDLTLLFCDLRRVHAPMYKVGTAACFVDAPGALTSFAAAVNHLLPPSVPGSLPVLRVGLQLRLRDHYASDQRNAAAAAAAATVDASGCHRPPFPAHFFSRCSSTE